MILTQTPGKTRVPPRDLVKYERHRARLAFDHVPLPGRADVETAAGRLAAAATPTLGQDALAIVRGVIGDDAVNARAVLEIAEGRTFTVSLGPGGVTLATSDRARASLADERSRRASKTRADALALYVDEAGDLDEPTGAPSREVWEWSSKSRARMFQTIPQLDMSAWLVAGSDDGATTGMVTLTYPGDWLAVAPDGKTVKAHVRKFRWRWERAIGPWVCLWKFEFQERGAPHMHLLMRVPVLVAGVAFEDWLSRTWADIVGADDTRCHGWDGIKAKVRDDHFGLLHAPMLAAECPCVVADTERRRHLAGGTGVDFDQRKMSDPRRIATYFLGHSSKHADGKEYQHVVPEAWRAPGKGPGRFWGHAGLDLVRVPVEVDQADFYALRRVLRHVARARAWRQGEQAKAAGKTPMARRRLRSLGAGGSITGGTVIVNDGVQLGHDLARFLAADPRPGNQAGTWPGGVDDHRRRVRCDCGRNTL